jgi:hypothetical protein
MEPFAFLAVLFGIAGWLAGWTWNKYEAASQCAALEQELTERHDMQLKTLNAALIHERTERRIMANDLAVAREALLRKRSA